MRFTYARVLPMLGCDHLYTSTRRCTTIVQPLGGRPIGNRHSQRKQMHSDNARMARGVASWVERAFPNVPS